MLYGSFLFTAESVIKEERVIIFHDIIFRASRAMREALVSLFFDFWPYYKYVKTYFLPKTFKG